jgi:hypothetical protein
MNIRLRTMLSGWLGAATITGALWVASVAAKAQSNTAYGVYAFSHNTTGNANSAFGGYALTYNSTGNANSAFGWNALFCNTTGFENTAIGVDALSGNATGVDNTAIGVDALSYNSGSYNTAIGGYALFENTTGVYNTATGFRALFANTTGYYNTAIGYEALVSNTTGIDNTATGLQALYTNTGSYNSAHGFEALFNNTTGNSNTAEGWATLFNNTTGNNNIALGHLAGSNLTTGSNNIDIGHPGSAKDNEVIRIGTIQKATYIAGINGITTSGGVAVYINSHGQLGTLTSSRRFKQDIEDMGEASEKLMRLRPVTFRYNDAAEKGPHALQYGLIAEEVARVYPDLVQYDKQGKPFTVYYHLLTPMLLNELQKEHRQVEAQKAEITVLKQTQASAIASLKSELAALKQEHQQSPSTYALFVGLGLSGAALLRRRRTH